MASFGRANFTTKMSLALSIIIVNHNTRDLLRQCLDSIYLQKEVAFEVIVVDNASTDESPEMVKKEFPQATLIVNQANVGFAKANNQAIKISKGKYILLLNSDTVSPKELLNHMVSFMNNNPKAGAVGGQLINQDGSLQRLSRGYFPSLKTAFNQFLFLSNIFPNSHLFQGLHREVKIDKAEEIDWISAACLMLRKSALEKAGLFDESFFMYVEDIDLCYRIKSCGYKIFSLPINIIHFGGSSSSNIKKEMAAMWLKNLHLFFLRRNNLLRTSIFDLLAFFGFLMRTGIYFAAFSLSLGKKYQQKPSLNLRLAKESLSLLVSTLSQTVFRHKS